MTIVSATPVAVAILAQQLYTQTKTSRGYLKRTTKLSGDALDANRLKTFLLETFGSKRGKQQAAVQRVSWGASVAFPTAGAIQCVSERRVNRLLKF